MVTMPWSSKGHPHDITQAFLNLKCLESPGILIVPVRASGLRCLKWVRRCFETPFQKSIYWKGRFFSTPVFWDLPVSGRVPFKRDPDETHGGIPAVEDSDVPRGVLHSSL